MGGCPNSTRNYCAPYCAGRNNGEYGTGGGGGGSGQGTGATWSASDQNPKGHVSLSRGGSRAGLVAHDHCALPTPPKTRRNPANAQARGRTSCSGESTLAGQGGQVPVDLPGVGVAAQPSKAGLSRLGSKGSPVALQQCGPGGRSLEYLSLDE